MQHAQAVPSELALPPEALHRICEILIATKTPAVNRRSYGQPNCYYVGLQTVLSLARTSRALHEHAADTLWNTIPSFGVLVYTLPRDIWSYETLGLGDEEDPEAGPLDIELNLKRPLVKADFARYIHYAPRVKRILHPAECTQFPPRTRSLLFSHNILDIFESYPHGGVLPNLRVLRSSPPLPYCQHFYRSFPSLFGPNVQEVFTRSPRVNPTAPRVDERDYRWMLTELYFIAPNLHNLVLNVEGQAESLAQANTPILSNIAVNTSQCLRAFLVGNMAINLYALRHLAELPCLMALAIKLDDAITAADLAFLREAGGETRFPLLQKVHLVHSSNLSILSLFVQAIHPTLTPLKVIDLTVDASIPFQDITDFLTTVADRDGARAIQSISLNCWVSPQSPGPHVLTEDHLRPFFALGELTCFDLDVKCEFDITNATLARIAAAWPNLTVLGLGPAHEIKTSKVTLDGLIPLARGCPRLKRLGLTIDAETPLEAPVDLSGPYGSLLLYGPTANVDLSMLPDPEVATPGSFEQKPLHESPLEELRLGRSAVNIDDPVVVAGFLFRLFPRLKKIHGQWRPLDILDPEIVGVELDLPAQEIREITAESEHRTVWHWVAAVALPEFRNVLKSERKASQGARAGEASLGPA
ncbi:hypothetical protein GSI_08809 [Ganoderma sinense ZZ0214-1]|uniref:F-box domain-containing protein n=1 Tax=Ganoderma sinense ZZ0214-1 TaxID=1077348 RepID=A0A2G8S4U4_9APHY|nr:hypothetical protein GSI_08809 [Ganoderma sinense ZZ0214-1]